MSAPLLEVRGLVKAYPVRSGLWGRRRALRAVDGVDLVVRQGEIVGLVGESGSGKTTLGRSILRLIEPTEGRIHFDGIDLRALGAGQLRRFRRRMQLVFQDPGAALNPRMKVRTLVGEPLVIHGIAHGRRLEAKVAALLEEVGLGAAAMDRYPHEFSGGQRQRIGIARALALRPEFVVCDEPVSALDVSVQAQIINLLAELQQRLGLAYLLISHDLSLVTHLCDRVVVLYLGRVMESGPGNDLHSRPLHPYTRALFDAAATAERPEAPQQAALLAGEIPSPLDLPSGCRFHPRCPWAEERCRREEPELRAVGDGRWVACHLAGDGR
ncbi:MAG: ABC transporter ATP-binding protein [Acidobacteriota bacterium]|nr:ABC transporter ATP-binding protein [Acidobacteriota bacterium]MDQ7087644.1 ABC transporter ATP-binding protein [Acidobacteriota bacterium]